MSSRSRTSTISPIVHFEGEDDKLLKLKPPVDYWIDYDKSVLTLHFTLPLETPVDTHGKPVAVDVYDPSFFVAFGFATEKPVALAGPDTKALYRRCHPA